ncbi:MAG: DNA-binding response regulator [Candidatus Accumulibacter sp. 66-26]|nr:response regulator transcription factor [Accumulibacter sp.]OJW52074.1 MAG: DNA-binding response regulator [Candidatus Accumulibacter sp. 66-26]
MAIRIMLIDDHKILRDALKTVLDREHDIALAGEASDGAEALKLVRENRPDVVVMDVGMPNMGGIETTRALLAEHPGLRVLALSTYSDRRIVLQMLDAGACGYVVKSAGRDELLRAIRAVAQGRTYLCPEISAVVIDTVRGGKKSIDKNGDIRLGRREREVLQLLAEGCTSPIIAGRLHIATSTVEVHRRNIMRKLDLHSVAELTKYAVRNGLTSS